MSTAASGGREVQQGIVLRSTAGFFDVLLPTGVVRARLRGRLKQVKQNTDLCVIGDHVQVAQNENGSVTVEEVLPRRTVFSRQHPARGGHREDVLIANLDVLVIVMAFEAPPFVPRMIDRFLVIAEHNGVEAILVANKLDLRIEEDDYIDDALALYEGLGYRTFRTSTEDPDDPGIAGLRAALVGRVSAFSGPSGVPWAISSPAGAWIWPNAAYSSRRFTSCMVCRPSALRLWLWARPTPMLNTPSAQGKIQP